mmetsp:Transcript_40057/g.87430  ORF Transcript_40057/g.87430 Transcript_40057/m.87430 type:complete len:214 (+) Transcript_40057:300-941(+)
MSTTRSGLKFTSWRAAGSRASAMATASCTKLSMGTSASIIPEAMASLLLNRLPMSTPSRSTGGVSLALANSAKGFERRIPKFNSGKFRNPFSVRMIRQSQARARKTPPPNPCPLIAATVWQSITRMRPRTFQNPASISPVCLPFCPIQSTSSPLLKNFPVAVTTRALGCAWAATTSSAAFRRVVRAGLTLFWSPPTVRIRIGPCWVTVVPSWS